MPTENVDPDGQVVDCDGSGECHPESWIGDGFPDCEDQQYGADLTCYDNDGGDCGGLFANNGVVSPRTLNNNVSELLNQNVIELVGDINQRLRLDAAKYHNYLTKQFQSHILINNLINDAYYEYENINSSRDLQGYNVLRDGVEIGFTETTSYNDTNVVPGTEYCYTVIAVYDEGESSSSNEACASATSPPNPVALSVGDELLSVGEIGYIDISMENNDPVAGFQFTLGFNPSIANILNVSTTDRTAGFNVSTNNGIIVGFSLTGDVVLPGMDQL